MNRLNLARPISARKAIRRAIRKSRPRKDANVTFTQVHPEPNEDGTRSVPYLLARDGARYLRMPAGNVVRINHPTNKHDRAYYDELTLDAANPS